MMAIPATDESRNIGARGARRRARGGVAWLAVGVIAAAGLIGFDAPRAMRWVLAAPFTLSAIGFLQARERT